MTPAGRLAQRPPWLVRLPDTQGTGVAGAGVLIDPSHVLTCAHVVARQAGRSAHADGDLTDDAVHVEFPFTDGAPRCAARVVRWQPIGADQSGDLAVLRLDRPIEVTPAPLASPRSCQGHGFTVHGFPGGDPAARQARGTLGGASGPAGEWLQVDAGQGGWPIEHGFSGAPVFDEAAGAVVGIVAMRDSHRTGHVLPVSYLRKLWPDLGERVRWRLDLDPALKTHWLPRARGSEVESDSGDWYFVGRDAARQAICDWLDDPSEPALVVTGGPGTGKSALLAHLLVAADPFLAATVPSGGPRPRTGAFDIAIQVTGLTLDAVVARLRAAAAVDADSSDELLVALRERVQDGYRPLTVLVDAVEEAASIAEARKIAVFLRDVAATRAVRLLAGVRTAPEGTERARVLATFGKATRRIDLESRQFMRNFDVAEYVERRLHGEDDAGHYAGLPAAELRSIGRAVARQARYNFLIAQLASRWLTHPLTPVVDLADPHWEQGLPETVGDALERYLQTCGSDTALVRRMLAALAFARGDGLPRSATWLTVADALHPAHQHTLGELETVFQSAAHYLIERSGDEGDPAYRLYHDALEEHMRAQAGAADPERAIVATLRGTVPEGDWSRSARYVRDHLAEHAAAAGVLDELADDAGFLVHADSGSLLATLDAVTTEAGRAAATAYRVSSDQHRSRAPATRASLLALDAARLGFTDLRQRLNAALDSVGGPDDAAPRWRVLLATGSSIDLASLGKIRCAQRMNEAFALAELDFRTVVVAEGDLDTLRMWDLAAQRPIGRPMRSGLPARALAACELDGRPTALSGSETGSIQLWDLAGQTEVGQLRSGDTGMVRGITVAELDGNPIAVVVGDGRYSGQVWDLTTRQVIGHLAGEYVPTAVALAEVGDGLIAVTASQGVLRQWDVRQGRPLGKPMRGHRDRVLALAITDLDGRPVALSGGYDRTVRVWDLTRSEPIGPPLTGHTDEVTVIAATTIDDRPLGVSAGDQDGSVRVWDLATHRQVGQPRTGHRDPVGALAITTVNDRPTLITAGGHDQTIRLRRLQSGPAVGRSISDGHAHPVRAVAIGGLPGGRAVVSCEAAPGKALESYAFRAWGLDGDGRGRYREQTTARPATAVACGVIRGRPIALLGLWDGTVGLWDLDRLTPIGSPLPVGSGPILGITVGRVDHRDVAIVAGSSGEIGIYHIHDGGERLRKRRIRHRWTASQVGGVRSAATAVIGGEVYAIFGPTVTGRPVPVWNISANRRLALLPNDWNCEGVGLYEHDGKIVSVTVERLAVRVWDTKTATELCRLAFPEEVTCVSVDDDGTLAVGFGKDIAVYGRS